MRGAAQLLRTETEQQSTNRHCTLLSAPTVHDLQEEGYLQERDMGIGKEGDRRSTKVRAELPTLKKLAFEQYYEGNGAPWIFLESL